MVLYNEEKVTSLSSELLQACDRLDELARLDQDAFIAQPHLVASAKYHLIVAIEAAIDLANHIISMNRWRSPEDYADTFRVLQEQGLLNPEFVKSLQEMARFRNRLIHIYWKIDDLRIYEILKSDVGDVRKFLDVFLSALRL
ncbi:MAG: DUF86 domain-containing protein [Methanoregulaceae archaeon]|nr:DUF86 domain-containing protein [Methanoregulaceae archaeon]